MADISSLALERPAVLTRERRNGRIAALLATTALVAVAALLPDAARAQDATWSAGAGTGAFNNNGNWIPALVPTGTAFFGTSNITNLSFLSPTTIGGWTFNAGASNYNFANAQTLIFNGAGIAINGGGATISNVSGGILQFFGASTAGNAAITNSSVLSFFDASTAGSANITNIASGSFNFNDNSTAGNAIIINKGPLNFNGNSTAGSATITNNGGGIISFSGTSTAGGATVTNVATLNFNNGSTAGSATITNTFSGASGGSLSFNDTSSAGGAIITNSRIVDFFDGSTAGSATINNSGALTFRNNSTAGSATITNNDTLNFRNNGTAGNATITNSAGASVAFIDNSTGGNAAFTNGSGAQVDFSPSAGPAGDNKLTVGSIAGAGLFVLGANELTVGGNNLSTEVSGVISGVCGSLVKVGTGTLTTSGANTYTGPTTVSAGILDVTGSLGNTAVTVRNGGTLAGTGSIAGPVTIASGGTLMPGNGAPGTITVGPLAINAGSFLSYQLGTPNVVGGPTNDLTIVGGALTVNGDSLFVTNSAGFGPGTYRLINYTGALGGSGQIVVGTLPDGDTGVIQTSIAGQVNLVVSPPPPAIQFWDGATTVGNGIVEGGNGTWNNSSTNWTTSTGTFNSSWQGISAVFEGASGTVTVAEAIAYQSLQFSTNGYVVTASGSGMLTPSGVAPIIVDGGLTATIAAPINGSGGVEKTGLGTLIIAGADSYSGGTTISAGTLQIGSGGTSGSITGNVTDNGVLAFSRSDTVTFGGAISGTGALTQMGPGTLVLTNTNAYSGGTTISAGTLQIGNGGTSGSIVGDVTDNGILAFDLSNAASFGGVISGTGKLQQIGTAALTLSGTNTYSGGAAIDAGTVVVGNNSALGTGTVAMAAGTTLSFLNSNFTIANKITISGDPNFTPPSGTVQTLAGVIADGPSPGTLNMNGAGTLILSATNTYTGPTNVNAGTLMVNGSIASSSLTTVNAGGTLGGNGIVGSTVINGGGFLAPGPVGTPGTMTVTGNLAFQSGAFYAVQVNPTTASSTNVSGTASLAGTVAAMFAPGSYLPRSYTILTATGGRSGTFDALATSGLPADFQVSLSYPGNTAVLNLTAELVPEPTPPTPTPPTTPPFNFTVNQINVGRAIDNFFNNGGALPPAFLPLFGLTGRNLANALNQLSGEAATGGQQAAFQLGNQFLGVMLDPFVGGGNGIGGENGAALGFAPERAGVPEEIALAYASLLKAPVYKGPVAPLPRWTAWGSGYGGSNKTSGDPLVLGSHDLSARAGGVAGGLDYHFSRDTVAGFALAGGGTNWSLAQGLGGGQSDAFQAGAYGATRWGPAYLAAAFAFTNHWMSTDRVAFAADHLTAKFDAQSLGGRAEGGYRFVTGWGALAPYAAIQAQSFHAPAYSETDVTAGGFGLSYNARTGTDTRSELGARFDRAVPVNPDAVLALRARLAWAHDWVSDPTLGAVFQALPGASFIVNGAVPAKNSALTSAGAELRLAHGISLLGKFDGEFASHSSTYAGTGMVRYSW